MIRLKPPRRQRQKGGGELGYYRRKADPGPRTFIPPPSGIGCMLRLRQEEGGLAEVAADAETVLRLSIVFASKNIFAFPLCDNVRKGISILGCDRSPRCGSDILSA